MYTRHDEVPVLSAWPSQVDAEHFHVVYRALKRSARPIRLILPGLKTLELILQPNAWIIVDRSLHDLPVAAWVDFQADRREALHEPVACDLRYYHAHAAMITKRVLDLMDELLHEQLNDGGGAHDVLTFPERDQHEQD